MRCEYHFSFKCILIDDFVLAIFKHGRPFWVAKGMEQNVLFSPIVRSVDILNFKRQNVLHLE